MNVDVLTTAIALGFNGVAVIGGALAIGRFVGHITTSLDNIGGDVRRMEGWMERHDELHHDVVIRPFSQNGPRKRNRNVGVFDQDNPPRSRPR